MPRRFIKVGAFQGVAAGQTATLDLPVGDITYHHLQLQYGTSTGGGPNEANMNAELSEIRLKVDGKIQRRSSFQELMTIAKLNGIAFETGIVPIFFSEPWRRTPVGEDGLAWGTQDIESFQVEVDIDAGATAPTLFSPSAQIDRARRPMTGIIKWRKFRVNVTATGVQQFFPPRIDAYSRAHAFETTAADISDVKVIKDGETIIEATDDKLEPLMRANGLVPQTGLFHIPFDITQRVSDFEPLVVGPNNDLRRVGEFRWEFNMAVAASFDLITETFGPRD
jgi:hypothetical protein